MNERAKAVLEEEAENISANNGATPIQVRYHKSYPGADSPSTAPAIADMANVMSANRSLAVLSVSEKCSLSGDSEPMASDDERSITADLEPRKSASNRIVTGSSRSVKFSTSEIGGTAQSLVVMSPGKFLCK